MLQAKIKKLQKQLLVSYITSTQNSNIEFIQSKNMKIANCGFYVQWVVSKTCINLEMWNSMFIVITVLNRRTVTKAKKEFE